MVPGLSALLPKFLPGRITKILSKSSVMVKSDVTDKIINRHVSDIHPMITDNRFVSTENAEVGMRKLMEDMNLESTKELEAEETQLEVLEDTKAALKKAEKRVRFERVLEPVSADQEREQLDKQPKPQELRRSRRLRGLNPDD